MPRFRHTCGASSRLSRGEPPMRQGVCQCRERYEQEAERRLDAFRNGDYDRGRE